MSNAPIFEEFHTLINRADSIGRIAVETIGCVTTEEFDAYLDGRDFKTLIRELVLKDWMAKYGSLYPDIVG